MIFKFINGSNCWRYVLLPALVLTVLSGCTGGSTGASDELSTVTPPLPPSMTVTATVLPPPNPSDGVNYQTSEFTLQYGLGSIKADRAYQRGYWGQGVTVGIVDTGLSTTHPDFVGRVVPGYNFADTVAIINDADGHGTNVAGVIGAGANGSGVHGVAPSVSLMPLQIGDRNTGRLTGSSRAAFRYAADQNVPILNNSYGPVNFMAGVYKGQTISFFAPVLRFTKEKDSFWDNLLTPYTRDVATTIQDEDTVLVWSAGNGGWHTGGEVKYCLGQRLADCQSAGATVSYQTTTPEDLVSNLEATNENIRYLDFFSGVEQTITTYAYGLLSTLGIAPDSAAGYALLPAYEASLLGKWIAAVATDKNNLIAGFSNGCGEAKYWCIAAPGVDVVSTDTGSELGIGSGTSFAAPHVSGALAVLKSRFPDMPMETIVAILFATADDLGTPGVDDVYGHGLVNLDAATSIQGNVSLAIPAGSAGSTAGSALLSESKVSFSPVLLGFQKRLSGVSVAVNYLDSYYYNTPLSRMVDSSSSALPALGNAASDLLEGSQSVDLGYGLSAVMDASTGEFLRAGYEGESWRLSYRLCSDCVPSVWEVFDTNELAKPFFADNHQDVEVGLKLGEDFEFFAVAGLDEDARETEYDQIGLRWRQSLSSSWSIQTEVSRIEEEGTLLGGDYSGAFSVSGAETYQGQLQSHAALSGNWQLVGQYQFGWVDGKAAVGSIIRDFSSLRFDGWRVGLSGHSIFRGEDKIRFGVTGHTSLHRGQAQLVYGQAASEKVFVKDYHLNLADDYSTVYDQVSLVGDRALTYQLGYLLPLDRDAKIAFGVEHTASELEKDETALSIIWAWEF